GRVGAAEREHRLDGEAHAGLQLRAARPGPVVRDLWLLVHVGADAVADERADDAEAVGHPDVFDRGGDVADAGAGLRRGDAGHDREARGVDELTGFSIDLADDERPRTVTVPAVEDGADVDRHDQSLANGAVAGDAVDDLAVDRDARARRERARALPVAAAAEVALERRHGPRFADVPFGEAVEVAGADAGLELRLDQGEDLGHDPSSPSHLVDLAGRLAGDHVGCDAGRSRA